MNINHAEWSSENIKSKMRSSIAMQKEGLHSLAYSLTLDPAEEIRSALEDVARKDWRSLDTLLEETPDGLEAEVQDAPVLTAGNEAQYRTDTVALPENYQDSGYTAADDDGDAEVSYAHEETAERYEHEVKEHVQAQQLKMCHIELYPSAEIAERVENHKVSMGYAMRFLLYAITAATM